MSRSTSLVVGLALVVAAALLVLLLWPRGEDPPEARIRQHVVQMAVWAEKKQLGDIMDRVSDRFRMQGGYDKQELKQLLAGQLFRGQWVRVFTTDLEVRVISGTSAEVTVKFVFGRSDAKQLQDLARESVLSSYAIDARFEQEGDGEWRVVEASYREAPPL